MMFLAKFGLQISSVADFRDDVTVSIGGKYFEASQDVGVVKLF